MAIRRMSSQSNPNGLSKNADSTLVSANGVSTRRGMVLPFTPLAMSFDKVNYYVDMPATQGVPEDKLQLLWEVTDLEEVMELVELDNLKDAVVGLPGVTGLSTEQRKRLTIAVELVANPSIIFMDEPTSGLDARAAVIVMRTVRNTVHTGRTVVCTLHQPSGDIFEAFDEEIPGVPKIKPKYNPATWMLEVSSMSAELCLKMDFAEYYKSSALYHCWVCEFSGEYSGLRSY